jgi:outer membrane immunogenic protein
MKSKFMCLLVALASVGSTQPLLAGDGPVKAPVRKAPVYKAPVYKAPRPVVVDNWTGWYVGGHIGGGWSHNAFSDPLGGFISPGGTLGPSSSRFLGGLQLGANWQVNNIVWGIQGDVTFTSMNATIPASLVPTTILSNETKWISTLTGRVGYAWDRSLWYAKGGAAWVSNHYEAVDTTVPFDFTGHSVRSGYVAGGGWEYAFAPNWSTFIEYDYIGLSNKNVTVTDATFGAAPFGTKQNIQMAKVGVNYKFSPWIPAVPAW